LRNVRPTIDELVAEAVAHNQTSWNDKTRHQVEGIGCLISKVVGFDRVADITSFHVVQYRKTLNHISKNYGKSPNDHHLTLGELIAIGDRADAKKQSRLCMQSVGLYPL
jgi:hypothetical protein